MFDLDQFLEENEQVSRGFRGDVAPMKIQGGWAVFASQDTKLFPVTSDDAVGQVKKEAEEYMKSLNNDKAFLNVAVQQIWYMTEMISRDPWKKDWVENKRATNSPVRDENNEIKKDEQGRDIWAKSGDWLVFQSQWVGDAPPLDQEKHFGKKLWVHMMMVPHPEFNEKYPTKYTAQIDREESAATGVDVYKVNDDGEYIPQFIRVVNQVLGEDAAYAKEWYESQAGGASLGESLVDEELFALMPSNWTEEGFDDESWKEISKEIFDSIHNGDSMSKLKLSWKGTIGSGTLLQIEKLTKTYPVI